MKKTSIATGVFGLVLCALAMSGQTPEVAVTEFDAASIKQADGGANSIEVKPGMLTAHAATMETCLMWAYGVQTGQIAGVNSSITGRLGSDRYDIIAKTAVPVPEQQLKVIFQALLAERFRVEIRRETRNMSIYELRVDSRPLKLKESAAGQAYRLIARSKGNREWKGTTMAQFADSVAEAMRSPVIDATGLRGRYDFAVDLTPYLPADSGRVDVGLLLLSALPEQVGLRLAAKRASVEALIVTRLEKLSEN